MESISCPSSSVCVGVGIGASAVYTHGTVELRRSRSRASRLLRVRQLLRVCQRRHRVHVQRGHVELSFGRIDPGGYLRAIACPTTTFCVAVGTRQVVPFRQAHSPSRRSGSPVTDHLPSCRRRELDRPARAPGRRAPGTLRRREGSRARLKPWRVEDVWRSRRGRGVGARSPALARARGRVALRVRHRLPWSRQEPRRQMIGRAMTPSK